MQASNGAAAFDLDQAREHLSAAFGPDPAAPDRSKEISEDKQQAIVVAKDLRKRANVLLDDIDATDADELRALLAESQKAVADGDLPKLTQLNESLSDMLFYLED
jgi:DNA-directed RNA polymerase subunit F